MSSFTISNFKLSHDDLLIGNGYLFAGRSSNRNHCCVAAGYNYVVDGRKVAGQLGGGDEVLQLWDGHYESYGRSRVRIDCTIIG